MEPAAASSTLSPGHALLAGLMRGGGGGEACGTPPGAAADARSSISDNGAFPRACAGADLRAFRRDPAVVGIVENTLEWEARRLLKLALERQPHLAGVLAAVAEQDEVGGASTKALLPGTPPLACNTARYVYYVAELERRLGAERLQNAVVAEIGGGYGGLAAALSARFGGAGPRAIALFDLPEVLALARRFLVRVRGEAFVRERCIFVDGREAEAVREGAARALRELGVERFDVCVSTFALTECARQQQCAYVEAVALRSDAGLLVCNQLSGFNGVDSLGARELQAALLPGCAFGENEASWDVLSYVLTW